MTYSEFTTTLRESLLGVNTTTVILNLNTYSDLPSPSLRVDAVAILIENNNIQQLREATAVTIRIPELGSSTTVRVDNSTNPYRVVNRGQFGQYYMYYIETEAQRPILEVPPTIVDGREAYNNIEVIIEPIVEAGAYNYNTYNPLIGNTIIDRQSSYIVHSDRATTTDLTKTNPTNINSIIICRV